MKTAATSPMAISIDDPADFDLSTDDKDLVEHDSGRQFKTKLRRLTLTNFRSYINVAISLDGRPVALTGENGAGKTNILEALSLIGPGRGLRSARLSELARLGGDGGWAVSAELESGLDTYRLGVGALSDQPDRRVCRVDGEAVSGPSIFHQHLRFLWLTPAQDRLFMEGASDRRRFFDRMVSAHHENFNKLSNVYDHAMRQRQKLLDSGTQDEGWLQVLEQQMAEAGIAIADARRAMAILLTAQDVAGDDGLFPAADIALEGELEAALQTRPAAEVEDEFVERLKYQRRPDREAGRALYGPHRSDLVVGHRKKARPARLCSTGEQKALLIGLVLANAQALADLSQHPYQSAIPLVLLLDEIAAHLDADRRARLFDILDRLGFQVFMTGTDKSLFSAWQARAQHLVVADGRVHETNFV